MWGYEDNTSLQNPANMGAYLTSSFDGGIVIGQNYSAPDDSSGNPASQAYQFTLIDPSGTTHELESDNSSWNTYRTSDGSGYTFIPYVGSQNTKYAADAGYTYDPYIPTSGLGHLDSAEPLEWLENASDNHSTTESGLRLGTLYSPTGITYTSTIKPYTPGPDQNSYAAPGTPFYTPQALVSTETDPSNNSITRGPWYWSGYYSVGANGVSTSVADILTIYNSNPNPISTLSSLHGPYYKDSVGRIIPDAVTMQATHYGWNWQQSQVNASMNWGVPGPSGTTLPYTINYTTISNVPTWTAQGSITTPDPSTDIDVSGYAISSITLPNGTQWTFTYYDPSNPASAFLPPGEVLSPTGDAVSSGDLTRVITPTGGTISYTYTSTPFPPLNLQPGQPQPLYIYRCSGVCHAVASRTETDGLSGIHSRTTNYTYGIYTQDQQSIFPNCPMVPMPAGEPSVLYAYWTTETDPLGNDTVHSFCPVGVSNAIPVANQYHETMTQYYQGPSPSPTTGTGTGGTGTLLKTVTTSLQYQADIPTPNGQGNAGNINMLPAQITTTIPSGSTTSARQYSSIFTATKIGCGQGFNYAVGAVNDWYSTCEPYPSGSLSSSPPRTISIYYLSPTTEKTYSGMSTNGTPLRTTSTTYMFQPNPPAGYANAYMPALPLSVANADPTGNTTAQTTYGYDTTGHGNLISQSKWLNMTNQNVTTQTWYNSVGMPYKSQDADGNQTVVFGPNNQSGFMDQCSSGAVTYPQVVTKASGSTTTLPEMFMYNYDCNTNAMTSVTDPNNETTSYNYTYTGDSLGRLTEIDYGLGAPPLSQTAILSKAKLNYPSMTEVDVAQDQLLVGDGNINGTTLYDGLGRIIRKINSDGNSVCTTYNATGQVATVSNPASSCPASPGNLITYNYDPFGRVIKETEQDNNILWWCYNGVPDSTYTQPKDSKGQSICSPSPSNTNTGTASWVDSTDENGNHHQQVSNALGQLIASIEPDPQTGLLALETDYSYDTNGNLTTVTQYGNTSTDTTRTRSFTYDSLSRLLTSTNPETGTICYGQWSNGNCINGYDANGNLLYKTDARGITTSYSYDALNRLLTKSSSDGTTPSTCYAYDTATANGSAGIGRLASEWTQVGACGSAPPPTALTATKVLAYDAMGRVTSEHQCILKSCATTATPFSLGYTYDLAGNPIGTSIGAMHGVQALSLTNTYDAANRLNSLSSSWSDPQHPATLFSAPSYSPAGGVTAATYGTGFNLSRSYDNRLRIAGETDTGNSARAATPGSATVTISGAEQTQ